MLKNNDIGSQKGDHTSIYKHLLAPQGLKADRSSYLYLQLF